ncbi:hypothetical protein BIW11_10185 [Tropilaelaps mercedesae]|uniref:Uncharacterized protein n=1 Tax=Tropilaelaps mercedesae TaxID=418985 RepID=A0A1V9XH49_9ACAR|nr:hypothetical protein BIW11_10185 [Tropilaelaps mercedesae]
MMAVTFAAVFTLSTLCTLTLGNKSSGCGVLSNECANFILQDPQGPQMMALAMELSKSDPSDTQRAPLVCNNQSFDLSAPKWKLANQAIRKGLPEQILANMLEKSGQIKTNLPDPRFQKATQRILPAGNAPPKPEFQAAPSIPCSIVCTRAGEMNVRIGNLQLAMEQLTRLGHWMDAKTLKEMASMLRSAGMPVVQRGNYMTILPSDDFSLKNEMVMRIYALDGVPVRMQLSTGGRSFQLPGQEDHLNNMLAIDTGMAYPVMKLLAHHGIPAEFDCNKKTLTTALSANHPFAAPKANAPTTPIPAIAPEFVRIGSSVFNLPMQWLSVRDALQSNELPASKVQKVAEEREIAVPNDMQDIIFKKIMQMRDELMPVIRGNDCVFVLAGYPFSMDTQAESLSRALHEADVPRELVRDSLMRVSLEAKNTPSGLEVTLPSQQSCLINNVPKYKIFEYKIVKERNSVIVTAGLNSYRLPEDALDLKRAMDSGKVLPLELMDSLNKSDIPCNIDLTSGRMIMSIPKQQLTMALPMTGKTGKLKLHPLEGPLGTSYVLEYDGGRLHLPSQIDKLNQLIAQGTLNSYDVLHLFLQNTLAPYHFDRARKLHILEIAGQKLKILPTSLD